MTKEKLQNYIFNNYSSYDIAKAENKGQTTIRYWLKKHNLKTDGRIREQSTINNQTYYICGSCKKHKPTDQFYKKTETTKQFYCKDCFNEYVKQRWKERKKKAIEYKGGKCASCGYNRCPDVLEFHHRNSETKEFDWKKLRQMAWNKALKELDKCDLLCANCHREKHYELFSQN